jgi:hypothetical protein
MSQSDLDINRQIRRVFVRHWIDLGKLAARSVNSRITIRGRLDRIFGNHEELTSAIVDSMFQELKRIPNSTLSRVDLDNWTEVGGGWRSAELQKKDTGQTSSSAPTTYDLDKNPDG